MRLLYRCYGLVLLLANALPAAHAGTQSIVMEIFVVQGSGSSFPPPGQLASNHWRPVAAAKDQLRVASLDVGALCDAIAGNTPVPCTTPEPNHVEVDLQLARLAEYLDLVAGAPAVVALQQVENEVVLNELADQLDARVANSSYVGLMFEGGDPRGLDLAFLIDTSRIAGAMVNQLAESEIDPSQGGHQLLHPKAPLLLSAVFTAPGDGAVQAFRVLNVIVDDRTGLNASSFNARERRFAQASSIAALIRQMQHDAQGLSAPLIVTGKLQLLVAGLLSGDSS